jgi:hypothetical protein
MRHLLHKRKFLHVLQGLEISRSQRSQRSKAHYRSLAFREEQLWSKDVRKNQSLQFILMEPQCEMC